MSCDCLALLLLSWFVADDPMGPFGSTWLVRAMPRPKGLGRDHNMSIVISF